MCSKFFSKERPVTLINTAKGFGVKTPRGVQSITNSQAFGTDLFGDHVAKSF